MCGTSPGSIETFEEQVCMPINGRVQCIDKCISQIVASLNAGNVQTEASCCGHKKIPGSILLKDGRCLIICGGIKEHDALISYGILKRNQMFCKDESCKHNVSGFGGCKLYSEKVCSYESIKGE